MGNPVLEPFFLGADSARHDLVDVLVNGTIHQPQLVEGGGYCGGGSRYAATNLVLNCNCTASMKACAMERVTKTSCRTKRSSIGSSL